MPGTASVWSPDSGCVFSGRSEPSLSLGRLLSLSSLPGTCEEEHGSCVGWCVASQHLPFTYECGAGGTR